MCKYCEFTRVDEVEKENEVKVIERLEENPITTELSLYRYHDKNGGHVGQLILSRYLTGSLVEVSDNVINIKYCPFCGEKL